MEPYADGEASAHELAAARFGPRHRSEGLAALLAWEPDLPPCPACGDVPETVIVEVVVRTREEALAAMASISSMGEILR